MSSKELLKALVKVLPFSSTSEDRGNSVGVLIETTNEGIRLVASDSFRLGYVDTFSYGNEE